MKKTYKIIGITAVIISLAAVALLAAYAATSPKVKIIATETAAEVNVEIKAAGNIEKFVAYSINVGYSKDKLGLKAGSVNVTKPAGWTLDTYSDKTVYGDSSKGYVTVSNAWYSIGSEGSTIAVSPTSDVTLATFTFTKKAAVTAADIFQSTTGFKYGVAPAMVAYSWIMDDAATISAKDTAGLIEHSFTPYNSGGNPEPTNPGTSLWVKSVKNSGGTAYSSISGGIAAGSYVTVENNKSTQVSAVCVITLYDQSGRLMKTQTLAAANVAADAEANIPIPAAIDTTGAKTMKVLPYVGTVDPAKPGGTALMLN